MRLSLALLLFSSLLLSACGSKPELASSPNVELAELSELPAPVPNIAGEITREYRIGPYDILQIDVVGLTDLSRETQVDLSGRIGYPLAGSIMAAGQTPLEVANEIETRLKDNYVRDPRVSVVIKEIASARVTVDGQVTRPGNYPVLGNMTLQRAVASAEGITDFAKTDDVVVFRTVEGQRYAALYNLEAIRRGAYDDPLIYSNDIVIVGESRSRRLFDSFLKLVPLITTPIVVIANN